MRPVLAATVALTLLGASAGGGTRAAGEPTAGRGAAAAGPQPFGDGDFTGGFRMEGAPKMVTAFGDSALFRRHVDRYFVVLGEMQREREQFARSVQAILASLAAHRAAATGKTLACPADAISLAYARAFRHGQTYHRLGRELEATHQSIRSLDQLGETRGLTPDYRWKVSRALKAYEQVLVDFREMRVAFQTELASELAFHGCDPQALVVKGEELEKSGVVPPVQPVAASPVMGPSATAPKTRKGAKPAREPVAPVVASMATFFVDNSSCGGTVRVYLDGTMVGEIGARSKAAFRSLVGRHDLCLIPSTSKKQCGELGTLRRTYIHDGWSIALRCD